MLSFNGKYIYLFAPLLWIVQPITSYATQEQQPVSHSMLYKEECASCHMAYPAMLLPTRSWQKIMSSLDNHFGDNASLDAATLQTLSQYLQDNSADVSNSHRARKILKSLPGDDAPIRISTLPYIQHKHDEIPDRHIRSNPEVKSLANCAACHTGAEQGSFDDDNVRIPGYGRWDD